MTSDAIAAWYIDPASAIFVKTALGPDQMDVGLKDQVTAEGVTGEDQTDTNITNRQASWRFLRE